MSALPLPCRHIQQIAGLLKIHSLTFSQASPDFGTNRKTT